MVYGYFGEMGCRVLLVLYTHEGDMFMWLCQQLDDSFASIGSCVRRYGCLFGVRGTNS